MFWLIVATGISLVFMFISAFFGETQDGGSRDTADGKSWWSSTKEWICNERKIVTAARIVFLSMVTASLIILLGIFYYHGDSHISESSLLVDWSYQCRVRCVRGY
jgi:hypothetical protein